MPRKVPPPAPPPAPPSDPLDELTRQLPVPDAVRAVSVLCCAYFAVHFLLAVGTGLDCYGRDVRPRGRAENRYASCILASKKAVVHIIVVHHSMCS